MIDDQAAMLRHIGQEREAEIMRALLRWLRTAFYSAAATFAAVIALGAFWLFY